MMEGSRLNEKNVVLGITGCIAAYKSAELVRDIVKRGGRVHVVMTDSAREFVSPLTFQTLSGNPVVTGLFSLYEEKEIGHISLAQKADVLVVAPATANILGKVAGGIADDMLTTVIMATRAPVMFAPAMNVNMWENPVVQKNIRELTQRGFLFIAPGTGDLACGAKGPGRLADIGDITEEVLSILSPKDFIGRRLLVTAGPTREPMDPVRFLSNPSSGKMGFAIARAAIRRGGDVTLVSGPVELPPPRQAHFVKVQTALEMSAEVEKCFERADIVIKTAAVADYRPRDRADQKIKKQGEGRAITLERNPDILAALGGKKGNRILVGFAAETQNLIDHAREKLKNKNLDMIVVNDVSRNDSGFGTDVNKVTLLTSEQGTEDLPLMSKDEVADRVLDAILKLKQTG